MSEYLTLDEAADYLRRPVDTLRHWRKQGYGPKAARVGRGLLYRRAEIDAWVAQQEREQQAERAQPA
jgi:excisionase family DNA binding protein